MSVSKLWSVLLFVVMGYVAGITTPPAVEAENLDLLPADWIQVVPIELTTPPGNGEEADVYFPAPPANLRSSFEDAFPVVAMLQGGLVDKSHYEEFGRQLARFGFVVVIPNHFENLPPTFTPVPFPNEFMIPAVLAQLKVEDTTLHRLQLYSPESSGPALCHRQQHHSGGAGPGLRGWRLYTGPGPSHFRKQPH